MTDRELRARQDRIEKVNALLRLIASHGRRFFRHRDDRTGAERVSQFFMDPTGRIWLMDKHTWRPVWVSYPGRWREFTEGHTLRLLIEALRDYIRTGKLVSPHHLGPWPDWDCDGDPWGYGKETMQTVRDGARELEIFWQPIEQTA
jgi:hypothetical protein